MIKSGTVDDNDDDGFKNMRKSEMQSGFSFIKSDFKILSKKFLIL